MPNETILSIRDLAPLEKGGVIARKGFDFQDHIAAAFCLKMISSPALTEVWCETQDDITLIHREDHYESVEFVQVKRSEPDQLWTVALLCASSDGGKSIVEKSLSQDRCRESCSFRIVTLREVSSALKVLTYPISSPARSADQEVIKQLCADVCNKLSGSKSPNGNDGSFWVLRAIWDVRGSEQAVRNDNLLSINSLVHDRDGYLAPDQLGEFYQKLLSLVRDVALADWEIDPTKKKITRDTFLRWFERTVREAQFPASSGTGSRLIGKMRAAGLNQDYIDTALEQRAAYRRESLSSQYLSLSDVELTAREVSAYLTCLRSELDAGLITDDGIQFHHRCLNALKELQAKIRTNSEPHLSFLQGCMYDITNRCLHRFVRAKA